MSTTVSSALVALSDDLASAVERVAPSVVYVDGSPRRDASGLAWDEHMIVTVDHAIERDDEIEVYVDSGSHVRATLVGRDPSTDLALLRVDAALTPAPRASLEALRVGHIVLAVGRDEDARPGASLGVVSALDGPWRTWRGGEVDRFLRPDVTMYSGFSGGPLLDSRGLVLGINTAGLSRRTALTVPLSTVERVVTQLLSGGRIRRGYLGIAMQQVRLSPALRAAHALEADGAVIVVDVAADGPAERAGLLMGDVILAIGGRTVEDSDDLQYALGAESVGTSQTLRILRGGVLREVSVTVSERPGDDE
jgi:S1-C subfamily serine protease